MQKSIYERFDSSFGQVSAWALLDSSGGYIGRIAFKWPRDGMGRAYCYFQLWGAAMARGSASGCGYDKGSAAFDSALEAWAAMQREAGKTDSPIRAEIVRLYTLIADCRANAGGERWTHSLESKGFRVCCVID